jgi:hypothetical protein
MMFARLLAEVGITFVDDRWFGGAMQMWLDNCQVGWTSICYEGKDKFWMRYRLLVGRFLVEVKG